MSAARSFSRSAPLSPLDQHSLKSRTTASTIRNPSVGLGKRSSARSEAELIQARGRIAQLELELSKVQWEAKRARIETESAFGVEERTIKVSQELERLHTVSNFRANCSLQ